MTEKKHTPEDDQINGDQGLGERLAQQADTDPREAKADESGSQDTAGKAHDRSRRDAYAHEGNGLQGAGTPGTGNPR